MRRGSVVSRSGTPAPVSADPAATGTTAPRPTWVRAERSAIASVTPGPSRAAPSSRSSPDARTSITDGSVSGTGLVAAPGDPAASTSVRGSRRAPEPAARRRPIPARTRAGSAPWRSILLMKIAAGTARRRSTRHKDDGLRLHSLDRGDHQDGRVEDGQAALDLGDEVGVTRGVDEIDLNIARGERRHVRAHGDATAALDVHRVGTGGAGIDAAEFGDGASLEQQPFGQAGLARVNMRQDSEVECAQGTTAPGVGSGLSAGQLPHASRVPPGEAVRGQSITAQPGAPPQPIFRMLVIPGNADRQLARFVAWRSLRDSPRS